VLDHPTVEILESLKERINFSLQCQDIKKIEIEFINKEPNDTKVVNDEIIEDLNIIIETVKIDKIEFTNQLPNILVYSDNYGKRHYTNGFMSFNGKITIKIHKNILYTKWLAGLI